MQVYLINYLSFLHEVVTIDFTKLIWNITFLFKISYIMQV